MAKAGYIQCYECTYKDVKMNSCPVCERKFRVPKNQGPTICDQCKEEVAQDARELVQNLPQDEQKPVGMIQLAQRHEGAFDFSKYHYVMMFPKE